MPRSFTIRKGALSDLDAVRQCVDAAYSPYIPRIGTRPSSLDTDFGPLLSDGVVWVAAIDGRVVPLLVLLDDAEGLEIRSVAVLPERQQQGIGRALMAHAERIAIEAQHSTLRLYTNAKLPELVAYYMALGYVEVERRREHGYARVFMSKRLTT